MDYHFGHAAAYGLPGAALVVGGMQIHNPAWVGYILLACGTVLLAICIAVIALCVYADAVATYRNQREAAGITPDSVLLRERTGLVDRCRGMDEDTKRIILDNIQILGVSYNLFDDEPLVGYTSVPYWFLIGEWLPLCDERFLAPVGNWNDGTREQGYAKQLTKLFVNRMQATEAKTGNQWVGGNVPARWIDPAIYHQLRKYYIDRVDDGPSPSGEGRRDG